MIFPNGTSFSKPPRIFITPYSTSKNKALGSATFSVHTIDIEKNTFQIRYLNNSSVQCLPVIYWIAIERF